ncbi:hypothetical protein ITP53_15610 [Nonomuraea sp. K274]|uniref:Uncharacterized protein n=1 Tax=Nonomuraea cypriaca TaxID=1187855 RepID=A0A931A8H8_9ACTN|nr:hypothetical protein [Nonomuraea cypriaca]MBF8187138.1 hypothetical protein [Nonomuraea cypriaca]
MSDLRVARYVSKYATKGAESAGTVDRPIRHAWEIAGLKVTLASGLTTARWKPMACRGPTGLRQLDQST